MDPTQTTAQPLGIDADSVDRWLTANLPGAQAPFRYDRITGGHSNLTYLVTGQDGVRYVLRRPPVGHLLATAHNVIREHLVMGGVAGSGVPVPVMLGACTDESVTGAPFYVMEYVDGVVVDTEADADRLLPDHGARKRVGEGLIDALVALHEVDVESAGLTPRGGYLERQLSRWSKQWQSAGLDDLLDMNTLHSWLLENQPAESEPRIVHGDFRLGNSLVDANGQVLAILDWELCTVGEPLLDLAYFLRSWSAPDLRPGFDRPPATSAGFLGAPDLAGLYAERSGRSIDGLYFWQAFTAWRSAAILAGVYRRYLDGQLGDRPNDLHLFRDEVESRIVQGLTIARAH